MIVLAGAFRAFPRRVRSASAGGLGLRGTRRRSARSDARCVLMRGGSGFWGRYARWARWNVRLGACEAVSAFRRAVSQSRCARRLRAGCTARRGLCSGWRVARRRGLQAAFAAGLGGKRLHSCTWLGALLAFAGRVSAPSVETCGSASGADSTGGWCRPPLRGELPGVVRRLRRFLRWRRRWALLPGAFVVAPPAGPSSSAGIRQWPSLLASSSV